VKVYRRAVVAISAVIAALGVVLLAVTAAHGGGAVGFVVGALFLALGVARITLERKRGPL
jgi:TRAP-type mannitol/chloroaromatic compound transport system permease large subunit